MGYLDLSTWQTNQNTENPKIAWNLGMPIPTRPLFNIGEKKIMGHPQLSVH